MLTHLVFFRLKPEAEGRSAADNTELLVERLRALGGVVPSLRALDAGANIITPTDFDVGLMTRFDDRAGLEAYRVHPAHQEVIRFVQAVTEARAAVDFEHS